MVAGRGSGCSHIADHLALHHLLSHRDADGGAVRIERFLPISVIQFHVISIAAAPGVGAVGSDDDAVRSGQNGRPARRGDVRPAMVGGFSGCLLYTSDAADEL